MFVASGSRWFAELEGWALSGKFQHVPAQARLVTALVMEAIKLHVLDRVYYPDVMIARGSAAEVELMIEEPSLVVEVMSPSTQAKDHSPISAPE